MKPVIYFRADGNSTIGLGHVYRSLALAEMLQEKFYCHFIIQNPPAYLEEKILTICQSILPLPVTKEYFKEAETISKEILTENQIIVLDGYNFDTAYQQQIKLARAKLVCIDDINDFPFVADVIINHAGGIKKEAYKATLHTQFCLGLKYALLQKPFRIVEKEKTKPNNNLFVCLGGADPNNDVLKVLQKCEKFNDIEQVYLVIGGAYQHFDELQQFLESTLLKITLLQNLNTSQMACYMQQCSQAITSPSTISYEYLSVGGVLYMYQTAANQSSIYQYFIKKTLAFDFKYFPIKNKKKIAQLIENQSVFDGKQKKRYLQIFNFLILTVNKATSRDCLQYYHWANDVDTRKQSYNTKPIPLEDHEKWFKSKLASINSTLYLIKLNGINIGQIRFELENEEAIISYSLDSAYRGKGLGVALLRKGIAQFLIEKKEKFKIIGFVKTNNIPSVKAFRSIGFNEYQAEFLDSSYKYILE